MTCRHRSMTSPARRSLSLLLLLLLLLLPSIDESSALLVLRPASL